MDLQFDHVIYTRPAIPSDIHPLQEDAVRAFAKSQISQMTKYLNTGFQDDPVKSAEYKVQNRNGRLEIGFQAETNRPLTEKELENVGKNLYVATAIFATSFENQPFADVEEGQIAFPYYEGWSYVAPSIESQIETREMDGILTKIGINGGQSYDYTIPSNKWPDLPDLSRGIVSEGNPFLNYDGKQMLIDVKEHLNGEQNLMNDANHLMIRQTGDDIHIMFNCEKPLSEDQALNVKKALENWGEANASRSYNAMATLKEMNDCRMTLAEAVAELSEDNSLNL